MPAIVKELVNPLKIIKIDPEEMCKVKRAYDTGLPRGHIDADEATFDCPN
jgi:hypothetical protein